MNNAKVRTIFITGTDTSVGKTLLTALLLTHLRAAGRRTLALKPFSSGGREDAELLFKLQGGELTLNEINPFHYPEPLAPLVAARLQRRVVGLREVLAHSQRIKQRLRSKPAIRTRRAGVRRRRNPQSAILLIEGVGGLMVPLGEKYLVLDMIKRLRCEVIVVAANRLGVLNHALLTTRTLRNAGIHRIKVVLMGQPGPDQSSASNPAVLSQFLQPTPLINLPFFGPDCCRPDPLRKLHVNVQESLAALLQVPG